MAANTEHSVEVQVSNDARVSASGAKPAEASVPAMVEVRGRASIGASIVPFQGALVEHTDSCS